MSRREMIQMTDDEVRSYLEEHRTLQVASINADGTPHLVTMWYGIIDGNIVFWSYRRSQKIVNLRRDPRMTCLVESGNFYEELRGVTITGIAEISDDRDYVQRVGEAVMAGYNFTPVQGDIRSVVAQLGVKRSAVTLKPSKVVSWDHRKLGGNY